MEFRKAAVAHAIGLSFILGAVTACSSGSEGGPQAPGEDIAEEGATPPSGFQFATSDTVPFDLVVQLDGVPVKGAVVQLVDWMDTTDLTALETASLGETFFKSTTDASGASAADVRVPLDREMLDLVIDLPSATGPYTVESLRTHWGIFAPASRTTIDRENFAGLQLISLTSL